jgi:adenylyltransferase/sulfurtransferase
VDFDRVEHSNLHRQLLHDTASVGRPKLDSARERLEALNPEVDVVTHEARLTSDNAFDVLEGYDLVVDGSDNFPTRYLVNDASVLLGIPSVYGAIFRFDGQASVFGADEGPCYRCLFREPPPPGLVPSCAEAGVLGVLPGIVGTIQAAEAVKLILGKGRTLAGRLLMIDALEMSFRELEIRRDPECPVCGEDPTVTELVDYEAFCGTAPGGDGAAAAAGTGDGAEAVGGAGHARAGAGGDGGRDAVSARELARRLEAGADVQLLDVRRDYEWEICNLGELGAVRIPLGELPDRLDELDEDRELVVYCRTGARSARAVDMLRRAGHPRAMNLEGGILAWARDVDPDMPEY